MYAYQTSLKLRIKTLDNFTLISLIILNFSDFQFCDNVILLFLLCFSIVYQTLSLPQIVSTQIIYYKIYFSKGNSFHETVMNCRFTDPRYENKS